MQRFLLFFLILFFFPIPVFAENIIEPEEIPESNNAYSLIICYSRSSADDYIDSLDPDTYRSLVRQLLSENDEFILARLVWGEDRENPRYMQAAIIWCVFNRMDVSGKSISQIVTSSQFPGYLKSNPIKEWAVNLVRDVTIRYMLEQIGYKDVGRVLPKKYLYFEQPAGSRFHVFKTHINIDDPDNKIWNWALPSPYPV